MSIGSLLLRFVVLIAMILILAPIFIVLVVAFSAGESLSFPPPGFSLRWFVAFFQISEMRNAFVLSIGLALVSACASTLLGLMGGVYVTRHRNRFATLLETLIIAPLVFPAIILGLALLLLFRSVHMGILPGLFIAHVVICLPYAFRAITTSLHSFDTTYEEAGQSLGAGPIRSFIQITLPIIWPGVLSGWLFAFIVSFGELNTALFLTGPGVVTLPIEMFSYLQFQGNQLVVAAASALQVFIIVLALLLVERFVGARQLVQR